MLPLPYFFSSCRSKQKPYKVHRVKINNITFAAGIDIVLNITTTANTRLTIYPIRPVNEDLGSVDGELVAVVDLVPVNDDGTDLLP